MIRIFERSLQVSDPIFQPLVLVHELLPSFDLLLLLSLTRVPPIGIRHFVFIKNLSERYDKWSKILSNICCLTLATCAEQRMAPRHMSVVATLRDQPNVLSAGDQSLQTAIYLM